MLPKNFFEMFLTFIRKKTLSVFFFIIRYWARQDMILK